MTGMLLWLGCQFQHARKFGNGAWTFLPFAVDGAL
jgi:hypothetical protein